MTFHLPGGQVGERRCKGDDHAHRLRRIGLRPRDTRHPRERGRAGGRRKKISAGMFQERPPLKCQCRYVLSAWMPADLITLAHLSVSSEMNFANPADVSGIGSTPRSTRRAFDLGSARAAFIASFSLLTISVGV